MGSEMCIRDSYSEDFSRIRLKVIEPAIKEIKDKDGMNVRWKPIKSGRRVVAIEFKFPIEKQEVIKFDDNKYIEENARPGETYDQARKRLFTDKKQ